MTPARDFDGAFAALKPLLARHVPVLAVATDTAVEYTVDCSKPSPFPQHKGHAMQFGSVRRGKAYVSFHLMPLYMHAELNGGISARLKKRMQGKTCFNFQGVPEAEDLAELKGLAAAGLKVWQAKGWA